MNKICPICGSDMYLEQTYTKDVADGWIWLCPNEDYEEQDNVENWVDPDLEYEENKIYQFVED